MVVYKCDRCLAYYDRDTDGVMITVKYAAENFDLCPKCAGSFYAWLGEPQATAKAMEKAMFAGKEQA